VSWSAANDSPATADGSAGRCFMCSAPGSGLSAALPAIGDAMVTDRPIRTSLAAASRRSGVM